MICDCILLVHMWGTAKEIKREANNTVVFTLMMLDRFSTRIFRIIFSDSLNLLCNSESNAAASLLSLGEPYSLASFCCFTST